MPLTTDQLIAQSKAMLAQTAAEGTKAFAGSSYDTNPTVPVTTQTSTPAITADSLAPQKPVEYQTTPPIQVPVVTPYQLTPEEQTAVTQETDLRKLIAGLTAETSTPFQEDARLKAEQAQGIAEKKSKLASFQNQQNALVAEAQGIQNQLALDIQNQQNLAQQGGANVTKGGLAPQTRALQTLANQSLLQNAIKQYGNNASMAAAQGDLTSALDYVDRAIQAEFLPKEKALAVAQANLTNLRNSSAFNEIQQKRADARQKELDAEKEKLATEKKNKETIEGIILQAVQNGAPDVLIQQARKGKNVFDVAGALTGWTAKETAQSIQEYNFAVKNGYIGSFTQYQNEDANRKISVAKAGVAKTASGLPSNIATQVDKLSSAFDSSPIVKNYNEVQNKKLSVDSILQTGIKGPADLALVYEFMKALDPTSVVRETEYSTAAASGNIFSGLYAKYNGYLTEGGGFLPEGVRKDFQSIINKKFDVATSQYDNLRKETARKIDMKTGSGDGVDYLTDYASASTQPKISKGSMSDAQFVEKAVKNSGQAYNDILSLAQKGEVAVVNNSTGEIEFIPAESVTSAYTRL